MCNRGLGIAPVNDLIQKVVFDLDGDSIRLHLNAPQSCLPTCFDVDFKVYEAH